MLLLILKRKRSSTVEPVWGTLINFLGLRRMTSRGIKCANQALLMASACYNFKKYLKYIQRRGITSANTMQETIGDFLIRFSLFQNSFSYDMTEADFSTTNELRQRECAISQL